jgi:L-asparaginase II
VSPIRPARDALEAGAVARQARGPARRHDVVKPPPVLVVERRGDVVESRHRGSVVQVGADGTLLRAIGDPEVPVNLRSAVKPFGLVAFVEAGGVEAFDLSTSELAIMAGSHSGEDLHVRTLQAIFRRAGISQSLLGCGSEGAPLDKLTAARLARDGEKPGQLRHMCSGQHTSILLLCKLNGWPLEEYWRPDHPVQRLYSEAVARVFGTSAALLITSTDSCGVPTYAFALSEVARAFALLADPGAVRPSDSRFSLAAALTRIRDAMISAPEMVAGTTDRLDTAVMKAASGRIAAKGGAEGLRGFGLLPGAAARRAGASGVAIKIEDGGGFDRATSAASVETLRQLGALDSTALAALSRYRYPIGVDPRGEQAAVAEAEFALAPLGELIG